MNILLVVGGLTKMKTKDLFCTKMFCDYEMGEKHPTSTPTLKRRLSITFINNLIRRE